MLFTKSVIDCGDRVTERPQPRDCEKHIDEPMDGAHEMRIGQEFSTLRRLSQASLYLAARRVRVRENANP